MDFFTHIVLSYFLNISLDSPDFLFGITIGILPDIDLFWSPLGKKYFWAKHRTVTHSISFIILLAVVCSIIASTFWPLSFWKILPFAILTGMLHIVSDLITTSGIPLLLPFSDREYKFELDKAINPYMIGSSFFSIVFLNSLGRIGYDYSKYKIFVMIISLLFAGYFLYKLIRKLSLIKKYSTQKDRYNVLPTSGLFVWYIVNKIEVDDSYSIKYGKLNLLKEMSPKFKIFNCKKDHGIRPPLNNSEKVKSYTYNLNEVKNYIKKFKFPLADVRKLENTGGKWVVFWYPLELVMLSRTSALKVEVSENGTYSAKRTFFVNVNSENNN